MTGFPTRPVVNDTSSFPFPPPFMRYTDGANSYANANIRLDLGEGVGQLFNGLGTAAPRTWDGTIVYNVAAVPEPTSAAADGPRPGRGLGPREASAGAVERPHPRGGAA